jgi:hypothetical protein
MLSSGDADLPDFGDASGAAQGFATVYEDGKVPLFIHFCCVGGTAIYRDEASL